jgi:hypothetical protein
MSLYKISKSHAKFLTVLGQILLLLTIVCVAEKMVGLPVKLTNLLNKIIFGFTKKNEIEFWSENQAVFLWISRF